MGWAVGFDNKWNRDIGYGVPAYCDHPGCGAEIDRGLGYVCGGEPHGGDHGCGLFFCPKHSEYGRGKEKQHKLFCAQCRARPKRAPFTATADHPRWLKHKATDPSWAQWRKEQTQLKKATS